MLFCGIIIGKGKTPSYPLDAYLKRKESELHNVQINNLQK